MTLHRNSVTGEIDSFSIAIPSHQTADIDDHNWQVAGLAKYLDDGDPADAIRSPVIRDALVLGCACGRSRWVKSEPTWPIEEAPR